MLTTFLAGLGFMHPALAQPFPQNPTPGQCARPPVTTPGAGPGGNLYASHIATLQPPDMPGNQNATYPSITPATPDTLTITPLTPDQTPTTPFPFSGGFNNPVLSSNAPETSSASPKGC